jgi:hypothetical protein
MSSLFQEEMDTLSPQVQWQLDQVEGYLLLKMPHRSREILENLPPQILDMNLIRVLWLNVYKSEENWSKTATQAATLAKDYPDEPGFMVDLAYAVRRCDSIEQAEQVLLEGHKSFPKEAIFPYNLGCYAAAKSDDGKALEYLRLAFNLEEGYRTVAMDDEDLESLQLALENDKKKPSN